MQYADVLDRATERAADFQRAALEAHAERAQYAGPPPEIVDGVAYCAKCGDEIPARRLAAMPGVGLCVRCQAKAEGGTNG